MAPSRKSKAAQTPRTKLFQCTGFGDCSMVFTRSEHLARHTRKHTGEKPYQCIVPGCNRMFSRFDNMMQHTQTHRTDDNKDNVSARPSTLSIDTRIHETPVGSLAPFDQHAAHGGLLSPISIGRSEDWDESGPSIASTHDCSSVSDAASPVLEHKQPLSVTDLCRSPKETIHLTPDEYEALEGFARFDQTPLFYESLKDLASVIRIAK